MFSQVSLCRASRKATCKQTFYQNLQNQRYHFVHYVHISNSFTFFFSSSIHQSIALFFLLSSHLQYRINHIAQASTRNPCILNGPLVLQILFILGFAECYFFVKMSSPSKRRDMDVMKLMMSDYTVEPINDGINEFNVEFHGPKESPYEGGVWKVRVELPDAYPYKSPSIGFLNKIYHPNVDELSGSVCLDVINQSWSPMYDLLNVFEAFLPQLLLYPNPSDPLNGDAASLMMKDKAQYEQKVKEYCERYAKKEHVTKTRSEGSDEEEVSDDEAYSNGRTDSDDDQIAGHADP